MFKIVGLMMIGFIFTGCTAATWELLYSDARVVYKDARYVLHEYKDIKEGK